MDAQTILAPLPGRDPDALAIGALYQLGRQSMIDSVHHLIEAGQRLIEKKESLKHGQWLPWLEANADALGFETRMTASRLMKAARTHVDECNVNAPFDEIEATRLNRIVWGNNVRGTEGTGENEWHTPEKHLALARKVLGDIDLDPASTALAQQTVQAVEYFTKKDDGLTKQWHGCVWLNPPYAQPLIAQFVAKMVDEWNASHLTAAIMLTHNYTDTAWFHQAAASADAICFTRGRIGFVDPQGTVAAPTQGQAFCYFGPDVGLFVREFSSIGFVLVPHGVPP